MNNYHGLLFSLQLNLGANHKSFIIVINLSKFELLVCFIYKH